jgi:DNA-directed RNA polymerase subunit RPC12/RpoP
MTQTTDRFLRFNCPRCMSPLQVGRSAAGSRRRCPRCQLVLDVPQKSTAAPSGDLYPLSQESGPSTAGLADQVPVTCNLCHTRMYATLEQVGRTITCPDCGGSAVVLPPVAPVPKPAASQIAPDVYPLCEEASPTSGGRRADDAPTIRVVCGRCHTMMYAPEDQAGRKIMCPDCGLSCVVPPPPPRRRETDVMASADDVYRLAQPYRMQPQDAPPLPTSLPPPPPPPPVSEPREPARTESRFDLCGERPVLPRHPFLTGTFTFPFYPGALTRTAALAIWPMLTVVLCAGSFQLSNSGDPGGMFAGGITLAITLIMIIIWFTFASACSLAVVRDTASGCDDIHNWPDMAFVDWILEPLYLFIALCACLLAIGAISPLLKRCDLPIETVAPTALFFLFPIVLLSMLENESPLGVISWPVCRTFWASFWGWAGFYLTTAALVAASAALVAAALAAGMVVGTIVTGAVESVAWLIYFRLLGRLAWYCTEHSVRPEIDAESDADENPDPQSAGGLQPR